jgi:hypothetical protein
MRSGTCRMLKLNTNVYVPFLIYAVSSSTVNYHRTLIEEPFSFLFCGVDKINLKNLKLNNMKLETIVKVTPDGGVEIPSDMKVGTGLMNMVKELRNNGWRTFEHHDNWIKNEHYPNPTFEQQFDTGNAYKEMLKTKK